MKEMVNKLDDNRENLVLDLTSRRVNFQESRVVEW